MINTVILIGCFKFNKSFTKDFYLLPKNAMLPFRDLSGCIMMHLPRLIRLGLHLYLALPSCDQVNRDGCARYINPVGFYRSSFNKY